MAHSIKTIATTFLLATVLTNYSFAQEMYASTGGKTAYANNAINIEGNNNTKTAVAADPATVAKFSTLFPTATNQKWTTSADNLFVSFLNNGRKGNASFTLKGEMNYAIVDCAMEQLPKAFCKTIKKDYASYHLFNAIEITAYKTVAYQAVLENTNGFVTLKYTIDGVVEEIQQVKKGNN
ncbi:MAG: hypothetical protein ABIN01_03375 [Ferruginibacter sp.]